MRAVSESVSEDDTVLDSAASFGTSMWRRFRWSGGTVSLRRSLPTVTRLGPSSSTAGADLLADRDHQVLVGAWAFALPGCGRE